MSGADRPPPSHAGPPPSEEKMAVRVQALLAKAESTPYPEEAEALTAKAQELMAKYAIDQLAVDARRGRTRAEVTSRRIDLDVTYARAKSSLLAATAEANRCKVVWSPATKVATVFGFPEDLDAVELLFTSLLTQATTAMLQASPPGSQGSSVRSFRHAFFLAYAGRVGQRLQEAARAAVQEARLEHGDDLLPALVRRDEAVDAAITDEFPRLRVHRHSVSNGRGLEAGAAAADRADLGGTRIGTG